MHEELLTVITEIEIIINSRPLSYVTHDDLEEPITHSHLLVGRRIISRPDYHCSNVDDNFTVTPQLLSGRMVFINRQLEQFWIRCKKEYLLELREAHRVNINNPLGREWAKVGNIVVIHNDDKRRGFWSTGCIEELLMGK